MSSLRGVITLAVKEAGKKDKKEVDYSTGMRQSRCAFCEYFVPENQGSNDGTCTKVKGRINGEMWCKLFRRK